MPDAHARCLTAFASGLRQKARTAGADARAPGATDTDRARAVALFEIVGLLLYEADDAGLAPADLGLGDFDPERDILGPMP
ncbi:MAG: hypothetical protein AAGK21_03450 [Bacteroidota bacterium]